MKNYYTDTYKKFLQIRSQYGGLFMSQDDPGEYFRVHRLLDLMRNHQVTCDNIEDYMNIEKISECGIPFNWYRWESSVQKDQMEQLYLNFHTSRSHKRKRGRVTQLRLRKIITEILEHRIDRYINPEKYMNNKILCIVGESGAGKTLASLHLQNKLNANTICSFTTRPPRSTEIEGREHHFIDIVPDPDELLAYTTFGGYEYFALKTQVYGECTVYVIDEDGLRNLKRDHGDEYRIFSVYITRDYKLKRKSGIPVNRIARDNDRVQLDRSEYDWVIENNSTKKNLFVNIESIYQTVYNTK